MFKKIAILFGLSFFIYIIPPGGFSAWSFESGIRWVYLFIIAFLIFNLLYPLLEKIALRFNILDFPNERKIHKIPVPRIGGLGIYLAFIFTLLRNFQFSREIVGILIGSSIIFFLGFFDDIKSISAFKRLFVQLLAALIAVEMGLSIKFPVNWGFYGILLSYVISILWIVGITNAFNFMDGIDGLASSMGVVISVIFLIVVVGTEQYKVMFITASLCGSICGFLIYNWNPARIFLGDGGSTFIGYVLACIGIYVSWANNNPVVAFSAPIMVLFIPIFDLIYTTISRIKNKQIASIKQWLEYTGRDHLHHRLLLIGFSIRETALFITLLNLLCGLIAITLVIKDENMRAYVSFLEIILLFIIVVMIMLVARNKISTIEKNGEVK
ncbi:MAG: undecaprenyl/decaprenyl-phosphate alpha-N-acetylglucosaminyl 1-phosphate transferase [Elusimicrobiota bacterium]